MPEVLDYYPLAIDIAPEKFSPAAPLLQRKPGNAMKPLLRTVVSAGIALITGCSGNFHSIYHRSVVDSGKSTITTIDAKQRAILQYQSKVCVEPSPDVFSVIAQSASGNLSAGKSADPKTYNAQVALAYATAEQGATISRTQTINMLRELMYRTCERNLNGSISSLEMPIQAIRDQRIMTSILAIEQLTGAIRPTVVTIGATSNGNAGSSNADAITALDKAFDAKAAADKTLASANETYAKLNGSTPSCDDLRKSDAAGGTISSTDQSRLVTCKKAASDVSSATQAQSQAADRLSALTSLGGKGGATGPASAAGQVQANVIDGGSNPSTVEVVAKAVKDIAEKSYDQDEFLLLCLKILSPESKIDLSGSDIKDRCVVYLSTAITLRTRINQKTLNNQLAIETAAIDNKFEKFWTKPQTQKDTLLNAAPSDGGDAIPIGKLKSEKNKLAASLLFRQLGDDTANYLSQ